MPRGHYKWTDKHRAIATKNAAKARIAKAKLPPKWNKEKIDRELKTLYLQEEKMSISNMEIKNCALLRAAQNQYGTWNKALKANNITTVREIEPNKKLLASAKIPSWELGYILGILCGDGSLGKTNYTIMLSTTNKDFALAFKNIIIRWSKLKPFWREYDRIMTRLQFKGKTFHYYDTGIQAKEVYTYLLSLGHFDTYEWSVPQIIIQNKTILCGFLSGWFDSEGNVMKYHEKLKNKSRKIRGFSVNLKGLTQIKEILQQIGIESCVGLFMKNNNSLTSNPKPYYYIGFGGKIKLQLFLEQVGFQIPLKQESLKNLLKTYGC
jgi:intein-encoded DNA endonuclease-like protein